MECIPHAFSTSKGTLIYIGDCYFILWWAREAKSMFEKEARTKKRYRITTELLAVYAGCILAQQRSNMIYNLLQSSITD